MDHRRPAAGLAALGARVPRVDWRAALIALVAMVVIGYILSFVLAAVIGDIQQQNVRFDINRTLAPRMAAIMRPDDLQSPLGGARLREVDAQVRRSVLGADTARVNVWNRDGVIVYSSEQELIGTKEATIPGTELGSALAGESVSEIESASARTAYDSQEPPTSIAMLETYVPLVLEGGGATLGVFEVYQDYTRAAAQASQVQRYVTWGLSGALLAAYAVLMWFVQRGVRVIRRQRDVLALQAADLERANDALVEGEDRFRSLVINASDVVLTIDRDGVIRYVSPSVENVWNWQADTLIGRPLMEYVTETSIKPLREALSWVLAASKKHTSVDFAVRVPGGQIEVQATLTNLLERASVGGVVLNCRDVTERRRWEDQLAYQAFHDMLTGLPNRAGFMSWLQQVADAPASESAMAVYFFDVDRFKAINDTMGHPAGDALLCNVARKLNTALPKAMVARLGGDEFAATMLASSEAEVVESARAVMAQFEEPFRFEGEVARVSLSAGIAFVPPGDRRSVSELMRAADVALYHVKSQGGAAFVFADDDLEAAWTHRRVLEVDLRRAVDRAQLRLAYQPLFRLDTRELVGVEALVRWAHPEYGVVFPGEFIPLAEGSGVMGEIGAWVRREAVKQMRAWLDRPGGLPPGFRVRINLSAIELGDPRLVDDIVQTLAEQDASPDSVEFEVTESVLVRDLASASAQLARLRAARVRVAIDDFGTGYSSLSYLWKLPVDTLKLDRAFTADLVADDKALAVGRTVLAMAATLGLEVVAEGIESEAQLLQLQALGCHLGQGYYLARPMDARAVEQLIDRAPEQELRAAS